MVLECIGGGFVVMLNEWDFDVNLFGEFGSWEILICLNFVLYVCGVEVFILDCLEWSGIGRVRVCVVDFYF